LRCTAVWILDTSTPFSTFASLCCLPTATLQCNAMRLSYRSPAYCVAFSPEGNGRRLLTGGHDLGICVFLTNSGVLQQKLRRVHRSYVMDLRWRKDGLVFASAGGDRTVGLWRGLPRTWYEYVSFPRARTHRVLARALALH